MYFHFNAVRCSSSAVVGTHKSPIAKGQCHRIIEGYNFIIDIFTERGIGLLLSLA